jgi:hypothetical protein
MRGLKQVLSDMIDFPWRMPELHRRHGEACRQARNPRLQISLHLQSSLSRKPAYYRNISSFCAREATANVTAVRSDIHAPLMENET